MAKKTREQKRVSKCETQDNPSSLTCIHIQFDEITKKKKKNTLTIAIILYKPKTNIIKEKRYAYEPSFICT